jgi:hypothetical protein
MFRLLLSHLQALYDTDPRLCCKRWGSRNELGAHLILDLYNRGPEDDSVRVETCSRK